MYECCICNQHGRRILSGILSHMREVHPNFSGEVACGVNGCALTSSIYEGLGTGTTGIYQSPFQELLALNKSKKMITLWRTWKLKKPSNPCYESTTAIGAKFILKTRDGWCWKTGQIQSHSSTAVDPNSHALWKQLL